MDKDKSDAQQKESISQNSEIGTVVMALKQTSTPIVEQISISQNTEIETVVMAPNQISTPIFEQSFIPQNSKKETVVIVPKQTSTAKVYQEMPAPVSKDLDLSNETISSSRREESLDLEYKKNTNIPDEKPTSSPKPEGLPSPEVDVEEDYDDENEEDYEPRTKKICSLKSRHKRNLSRQSRSRYTRHRTKKYEHRREHHSEKEKGYSKRDDASPKQCYGPGCTNAARPGSKYCSDDCGLKLAIKRIHEILPHRIQQWESSASVADERNRLSLENIRQDQLQAKECLTELDKKVEELEQLIVRAKRTTTVAEEENTDSEMEEAELSAYCVTCGHEIGARTTLKHMEKCFNKNTDSEMKEAELSAYCVTCGHEIGARTTLKHMEKCFNKYESQASFGSVYKTHIEGSNIFCDYYNTQQRTYCKRLRILCPEHSKEPKVDDNEVCGCPLVTNVFQLSGEFCRIPKKRCVKHYQWEKLRRAEIDMDRMRMLYKLDDLIEQERNIRIAMAHRGGILNLMLHQTICHDPMYDVPPVS